MNATYFIKSITVQNPFWCIIFYAVAFVASLSMISVDDTIYLDYLAQEKNATVITQTYQNMSSVSRVKLYVVNLEVLYLLIFIL